MSLLARLGGTHTTGSAGQRQGRSVGWMWWLLLALIALGELLVAALDPTLGILLHMLLLGGLLLYSCLGREPAARDLALALTLAPLIRLLSIALPLPRLPQMLWYPLVSVLLMLSFWLIVRALGTRRHELNLRRGRLCLELPLGLVGLGLGAVEYSILAPAPQPPASALVVVGMALSLLIFTGLVEELIFRGLLQHLAPLVLGRAGIWYVSLLFGVLHIGYLSLADVVFVTLVGLLFAYLVGLSGSLLGVTLAHGLTNITLFLLLPWAAAEAPELLPTLLTGLGLVGAMALIIVGGLLRMEAGLAAPSALGVPLVALRSLRRASGLTYHTLARQAGMAARALAEIELGMRAPQGDELARIAQVLGVQPEQLAAA